MQKGSNLRKLDRFLDKSLTYVQGELGAFVKPTRCAVDVTGSWGRRSAQVDLFGWLFIFVRTLVTLPIGYNGS